MPAELSARDMLVLQIAKRHPRESGRRVEEIRRLLGISDTAWAQLLNALIDTEAALAHDPVLVNRLRRMRNAKRRRPAA